MPVNTQQRQYDELAADNARLLNENARLQAGVDRLRMALKEIVDCWYLEDDSVGTAITKAENLIEASRKGSGACQ